MEPSVQRFRGHTITLCLIIVLFTPIAWLRGCLPGFSIVKLSFLLPTFGILGGMYFEAMQISYSFSSPPVLRQMNALCMPPVVPFYQVELTSYQSGIWGVSSGGRQQLSAVTGREPTLLEGH